MQVTMEAKDKIVNLSMLRSIIRDLRDDCAGMRRVNPDGRMNSWAARFEGYAAALEGHIPINPLPQTDQQILNTEKQERMEMDEDVVPETP